MEAISTRDGDFERDGDFDFGGEAPRTGGLDLAGEAARARAGDFAVFDFGITQWVARRATARALCWWS